MFQQLVQCTYDAMISIEQTSHTPSFFFTYFVVTMHLRNLSDVKPVNDLHMLAILNSVMFSALKNNGD